MPFLKIIAFLFLSFSTFFFYKILLRYFSLLKESVVTENNFKNRNADLDKLRKDVKALEDDYTDVFDLYEITKDLDKVLEEERLVSIFKDELKKFQIGFKDLKITHRISKEHDSVVNFALKSENKVFGYLEIDELDARFKKDMEVISNRIAMTIKRARLYKELEGLATTDSLTGLYTRNYCIQRLTEELKRSQDNNLSIGCVMADMDHFKKCNDKFGHLVGDVVLKETADIIKSCVRAIDLVARYGGEEFLIVMPQTSKEGAIFAAERIRREVLEFQFKAYDEVLKTSISLGIACFPQDSSDLNELIEKSDWAMYRSKKTGRNRVSVYGEK